MLAESGAASAIPSSALRMKIFEFIEQCKGKETKICSRSAICERLVSARKIGHYLIEICH